MNEKLKDIIRVLIEVVKIEYWLKENPNISEVECGEIKIKGDTAETIIYAKINKPIDKFRIVVGKDGIITKD